MDLSEASGVRRAERVAVVATGSAFFMVILDTSVVNLALPSIAADLDVGLSGLQWIVDGYALIFASLLLGAGSLGDRLGAKPVFLLGLLLFTVASALCGMAPTQAALNASRLLQGLGAALQLPTSLALLSHAVTDPARRAKAISAWAGAGALGIALGPVLGGVLVEAVGWRAIFLVNLPVGVLGAWLAWHGVPESPRAGRRRATSCGRHSRDVDLCPDRGRSRRLARAVSGYSRLPLRGRRYGIRRSRGASRGAADAAATAVPTGSILCDGGSRTSAQRRCLRTNFCPEPRFSGFARRIAN
jgi:MFS family permease